MTKEKKYLGVKIMFEDSTTFVSDSTTYYIGNTQNYLFVYNQKLKTTSVKKTSEVKGIEFPERKKKL